MSDWISVSDKMPPKGRDRILVCLSDHARKKTWFTDEGLVHEGQYTGSGFIISSMRRLCESGDVVAWMPMPKAYTEAPAEVDCGWK